MRTLIAVLAAVLVSGAARAQELTKDMCDQIEQRTGHRPPDCEKLVDGATTDDNNNAPATITSNAPASVTPTPPPPTYPGPANPVPGGTTPGGTTPGGTAPAGGSMTIPNYTAPAMTGGTPSSSDCDHWGTALDVAGSFTNYAFWMTDSKGVMAERKTLHGIYLEDASQNAGDARDRAAASVGAAQGCDALSGSAGAVHDAYQSEFDLLTAALKVCAEDSTAQYWSKCPQAVEDALKKDEDNRKSGGVLDRYLSAVDNGHSQCLSGGDRQAYEEMRQTPCQRTGEDGPNRCATARYGIATGRAGQLSKVINNLNAISAGSMFKPVAQTASGMVKDAQDKLWSVVHDTSQDRLLFEATYEVYGAQKMIDTGTQYCPN